MCANLPIMSLLTALGAIATSLALAQDPVKVDSNPNHYKVEVEKETSPMHYHPPTVVISQSDVRLRFTYPDGKTEERATTAGSIRFRPALTHTAENLSDTDFDAIEVELKPSPKSQ